MVKETFEQILAHVIDHLGTLLTRGVPLIKALQVIEADMEPPAGDIAGVAAKLIRSGDSLACSLERIGILPGQAIELIRDGETSGHLDRVLPDLARTLAAGKIAVTSPDRLDVLKETIDSEYRDVLQRANRLIIESLKACASDLHLEPLPEGGRARIRIDGVLKTTDHTFSAQEYRAMVARIKEMAALDVGETRIPQDGRIRIRSGDTTTAGEPMPARLLDLRVSVCPFVEGEKVVLRFLDRTGFPDGLEAIGISSEKIDRFQRWLAQPYGIILVSGPTGSGKTTTLYLMLRELGKRSRINVMTVEDPVEFILPEIYQMQINPGIGLTYPAALRSLMRQDPDAIGVGEIQTPEVAKLVAQVAQTGHIVMSQLHARNTAGTLKLMHDLGVPVHVLQETCIGVVSQRLLRRLCMTCRIPVSDAAKALYPEPLKSSPATLYDAEGCDECNHTGYRGRIVVMEFLEPHSDFWKALDAGAPADELMKMLPPDFQSMKDDGMQRVAEGKTTLAEVHRVLND